MERRIFLYLMILVTGRLLSGQSAARARPLIEPLHKGGLDHDLDQFSDTIVSDARPKGRKINGKVVIIGAGVAGLAAARRLALQGASVHVFEELPKPGGFCSTLRIGDYNFDLGPHIFSRPILKLAPFKPGDLDPESYTESFLLNGNVKRFPNEVIFDGYFGDLLLTLVKNTFSRDMKGYDDFENIAERAFGPKVTAEIFKPMIEKWCAAPLADLDARYMVSRIHAKVTPEMATKFASNMLKGFWRKYIGGAPEGEKAPLKGIFKELDLRPAPGYAGKIGAQIIPIRFMDRAGAIEVKCNSPLKEVLVENSRIRMVKAGNHSIAPDYVINTAPLNDFANSVIPDGLFDTLKDLQYLDILFAMVRVSKPRLLNTKWTWIPHKSYPFYRMSEMKTLHKRHAPEDCTGICLEATFAPGDNRINEPDEHWKKIAAAFLGNAFSLKDKDIIGVDIIRRKSAYPRFTKANCSKLASVLKSPYKAKEKSHNFAFNINNLSSAGRAGEFIYQLAPAAIRSGLRAAGEAADYLTDDDRSELS